MSRLLTNQLPGTSAYYNKHVYSRLDKTIPIASTDDPSSTLQWSLELGFLDPQNQISVLEIGCGAGRNLRALTQILPSATLFGFDGSITGLEMARRAVPLANLKSGDLHGIWPFKKQFDVILDITARIPESTTDEKMDTYGKSLFSALKPRGYVIIEAIECNDLSSLRFRQGKFITWEHNGDRKIERLISLKEAEEFYKNIGFTIIASRVEEVEANAFKTFREGLYN